MDNLLFFNRLTVTRFMTTLSFLINAEEPCFCQNGGYFDGSKCVCCGDFTGPYCEEYEGTGEYRHPTVTLHAGATNDIHCLHTGPIPPVRCGQSYCLNGGKCLSPLSGSCLCPPGYLGPHCDVCEYQSVLTCGCTCMAMYMDMSHMQLNAHACCV